MFCRKKTNPSEPDVAEHTGTDALGLERLIPRTLDAGTDVWA